MSEKVWTVREALAWTVDYLTRKGIEEPRRSAEWLLSAATGLSRVEIYTSFDRPLAPEERARFREGIERRAAGEPLQYVTGEMPFRHLVMRVRAGVFIPRPETEVLVDVALSLLPKAGEVTVADLCTGSGAVAVSLAHERPSLTVWASDLNPVAVEVTADNAARAGAADRVHVAEGDLFAPFPPELRGRLSLVVSNPPYIPSADIPTLPAEVLGFEPHLALDGGADGLETARRIADGAREWLVPGGALAMELDETRVATMAGELAAGGWRDARVERDLTGRDRVVAAILG